MQIDPKLFAASWFDGDILQVGVFKENPGKYTDVNITVNKHAASATGAQQSADLTKTFSNLERLDKLMSVNDVPLDQCLVKQAIYAAIEKETAAGNLCLNPKHNDTWVDFVCTAPKMYTKACASQDIWHGFQVNGLLNTTKNRVPVL